MVDTVSFSGGCFSFFIDYGGLGYNKITCAQMLFTDYGGFGSNKKHRVLWRYHLSCVCGNLVGEKWKNFLGRKEMQDKFEMEVYQTNFVAYFAFGFQCHQDPLILFISKDCRVLCDM